MTDQRVKSLAKAIIDFHEHNYYGAGQDNIEESYAHAEQAILTLLAPAAPQDEEFVERCIACQKPFVTGDRYYPDASGENIHAACCGPERDGYTLDGEPLPEGEPIPSPQIWNQPETAPQHQPRPPLAALVARWRAAADQIAQHYDENYEAQADPDKGFDEGVVETLRACADTLAALERKEASR